MKVKFYGGADEVGRSCVLVSEGRRELVLDYGVKVGRVEERPLIRKVPKNIVITHAHLDHAAYLAHLFRQPRDTNVYLTKPTRDLMQLMIADYMRVSRQRKFNKGAVLNNLLSRCRAVEFGQVVDAGLKFSLHNSGHMLGSAAVLVRGRDGGLLYSSDISTRASRIVNPVEMGLHAKALIIESTYGAVGDVQEPQKEVMERFRKLVNSTIKRDGKVLIPSFAVGRAQELILALDSYMRNGLIEPAPIYVDGMIKKALRIFRHNVVYARDELQRSILMSGSDPFKSRYVSIPKQKDRSDAISEGSIIITTSGMMKGGPVITYFRELAGDPKNLLLLVGYQAPGTPGRKVLDGEKKVRVRGEEVEVRMRVERLGLSGHADHNGL
ncbi:MAG: MBL fold metallo-hydrolase, partial [Candidatus Micrarchaeia archaeon]